MPLSRVTEVVGSGALSQTLEAGWDLGDKSCLAHLWDRAP